MQPVIAFPNMQSLAHAVKHTAELMDRRLTVRPWNLYEAENADWYFNPTTDWPAFRYGKGVLRRGGNNPGLQKSDLFSCFFVERGPAAKVMGAFPNLQKRGYITDSRWLWSSFMAAMEVRGLHSIIDQVTKASGLPVLLEIAVSIVTDAGFDEQVGRTWTRDGFVRFTIEEGELTLLESNIGNFLRTVSQTTRLESIPGALQQSNLDWVWIDLYIGVELGLQAHPIQSLPIWNDADVWKRTLRPWLDWIR
ncbi:MAG: hypothetical protein WBO46_16450 [Caldilineaceae bacterium]